MKGTLPPPDWEQSLRDEVSKAYPTLADLAKTCSELTGKADLLVHTPCGDWELSNSSPNPLSTTDKPQKLEEIVWKEISDEVHTICQHIGDYTYSSAEETLGTLIEKVIEKTADEVRREVKTAYGQPLSTFIQWKGTDLCMDWFCEVGHQNHWDGDFAYKISCDSCLREYYPESSVRLSLTEPLFT